MRFGFRTPSLKGRLTARMSPARALRHRAGLKAPRGLGLATDPQRALPNRVYQRTTVDATKGRLGRLHLFAIVAAVVAFVALR